VDILELRTSTDGTTWTTRTSNFGSYSSINSVFYGNDLWVAGGGYGEIITSTNATTWTTISSIFAQEIFSVAYGNNLWIAGEYTGQIKISTDAVTWETANSNFGTTAVRSIAYGNNLWVAGGNGGQLRTSTDATTWTTVNSNFGTTTIFSIGYGNDVWVAGGYYGQIRTSQNIYNNDYTLQLSDANSIIEMNSSGSNVLTIPANSTAAFEIGTSVDVVQTGAGQTTISPASNVTINSKDSNNKISAQYGAATLYKKGTNEWVMIGDLTS
jgi:hypothetical protein